MEKKNLITWIGLIALTVVSWQFSESDSLSQLGLLTIMIASIVKFAGVSFQFLELKHAHRFWKVSLMAIVLLFFALVFILFY